MKRSMKETAKTILAFVLLMSVLTGLSACGIRKTSEPELIPAPAPAEPAAASETEQQAVIEAPEEITEPAAEPAEEFAATPSLPQKPDIDIHSWEYLLNNSFNSIAEYQPPYSGFEEQGIDERIMEPARAFLDAARNAGFNAWYSAIYRNYDYQDSYFRSYVYNQAGGDAVKAAEEYLAPGLSDHQTGLCVDFTDRADYSAWYGDFDDDYMRDTDLYRWLTEHCAEYGFVLRYPEGKEAFFGTACRHPAHFRYVGTEAAKYMTENNLCLEEFIMLYDESLVFLPKP